MAVSRLSFAIGCAGSFSWSISRNILRFAVSILERSNPTNKICSFVFEEVDRDSFQPWSEQRDSTSCFACVLAVRPAVLNMRRYPFARGAFGSSSTSVSLMLAAARSLAAISQTWVLPTMPAELSRTILGSK